MTVTRPDTEPAPSNGPSPEVLERAHAWVLDRWPTTTRRRVAVIAVLVALGFVVISTIARLVGAAVDAGILAYVGIMVVCWVGAGGALVPVPGVRPLSWVMIVHQSTVLAAPIVVFLAALAMALGQTSYFLATRVGKRRRHEGHGRHHGSAAAPELDDASPGDAPTPGAKPPNRIVRQSRALLAKGKAAVEKRMATHPQRVILLVSVVPNPLTAFATVSAAATGVPFAHFFAASLTGFLILTIALAVAGQAILAVLGLA